MSSNSESNPQPTKGRLISHFEFRTILNHGKGWSDLWDSGDSGLWDRGIPSPALIDLVEAYQDTLFFPFRDGSESGSEIGSAGAGAGARGRGRERKRVLIPGCGRGYDAISLALHGFDTYGLEISSTAIQEAEAFAKRETVKPQECNFGKNYSRPGTETETGIGNIHFLQGDFFDSTWFDSIGCGAFDLVYDYTFLCALHPTQRPFWASRMAELIRPGGLLVCLEFPMYKDPQLPGPPWGVNGAHWELLAEENGGGFRRVLYVKPKRTFEVGTGTDMVSVWERVDR
ncbi:S-adenosyl-L-methionine-dependent methyltransferase [Aspergillus cavernicola]|uniref:S-adenosyl-L-methionine-dependent methyltransferase n=1 Tax=Aspergillus cavernicola TaxID=176166 RepID=A0ABR4J2E0_9EURO